jgi:4-amino-4-deoxy-L-arabinose transferase-like glycosyltransferase
MEEPSILDVLKARLASLFKAPPELPTSAGTPLPPGLFPDLEEDESDSPEVVPAPEADHRRVTIRIPYPSIRGFAWRTFIGLCLVVFAQRMFEPPRDNPAMSAALGIVGYLVALYFFVIAFRAREIVLPGLPALAPREPDLATLPLHSLITRVVVGLAGMVCGLTAYQLFGTNQLDGTNLVLWVLSINLILLAFWKRTPKQPAESDAVDQGTAPLGIYRQDGQLMVSFNMPRLRLPKITAWGILVVLIIAITVWFRFYRLGSVPPEMTSDHAEKLLDVWDILRGKYSVFFPRNTGREPLYVYLTAWVASFPSIGATFLALKVAAVIGGLLTLPYIYLLGKEMGSKSAGLWAVLFTGMAYWPNVIERFGLRISFYPLFVAPVMYYLIRGLRRQSRNDILMTGLFLGLGLLGYTPFRIVPFALVAVIGVYLLHREAKENRPTTLAWLGLIVLISVVVFIPLLSYAQHNWESFTFRAFSRFTDVERPLPGSALLIFLNNVWVGLLMFNWYDGQIWVHSVPDRPALDVISGALFLVGAGFILYRYIRERRWTDLCILLAIPLLSLPSTLSITFPAENPGLNRAAGAIVPAFLLVGFAFDAILSAIGLPVRAWARDKAGETETSMGEPETALRSTKKPFWHRVIGWGVALMLIYLSGLHNYILVFEEYNTQYTNSAWNTSDMARAIADFGRTTGSTANAWIVPYPYWVDTRLEGFWINEPGRDFAIAPESLSETTMLSGAKLFIVKPEDQASIDQLNRLYPNGVWSTFASKLPGKDFLLFNVPAQ